jgi:hypothetical protein
MPFLARFGAVLFSGATGSGAARLIIHSRMSAPARSMECEAQISRVSGKATFPDSPRRLAAQGPDGVNANVVSVAKLSEKKGENAITRNLFDSCTEITG